MKKEKLKRRIVELFTRNNNLEVGFVILQGELNSMLLENTDLSKQNAMLVAKIAEKSILIKSLNEKMIRKEQMLTTKSTLIQMKQLRIEVLTKKLSEK
jgi:hypothetical protein